MLFPISVNLDNPRKKKFNIFEKIFRDKKLNKKNDALPSDDMRERSSLIRAAAALAASAFLTFAQASAAEQFDALWDLPENEQFLADFMLAYPEAQLTGMNTCAGGPGFSPDYRTSLVFAANGHLAYKSVMLFSKKDGKPVPFRPDAMLKSFEKYETGEKDTSRIFYRFPNRLTGVYDYARTGNNGVIIPILYVGTNEALGRCQMFVPGKGRGFTDDAPPGKQESAAAE